MEGVAHALVSNVGNLVGEEFRLLRAVGGQVAELTDELAAMNAIIRMHSEADDNCAIDHFARQWMKQVRELAYDAEDCIHLYIFRIRCRRGVGLIVWSKRQIATLISRHRLAGDILQARAVTISERYVRYGVSLEALPSSPSFASAVPAAVTSEYALRPADSPDYFVGITEQVESLANSVRATEDHDMMKLTVFSIVGFGGLGKTTLAMEVCQQLELDFQRHAHVSVSQAFDSKKDLPELLKQVLRQIAKVKTEEDEKSISEREKILSALNVDQLADRLQTDLLDKRYLIVVDDVWTVKVWEAIHFRLPQSNCGSRIIVTTRMENVAKAASVSEDRCIYRMQPLKTEASKELFVSRVFGTSGTLPSELESITDNILRKCSGLPLAIVSIASLLAGYKSNNGRLEKWTRVCSSIGSEMENNPTLEGMRQLITLSYNYLPHHLKGCMMYFSIFPEDYEIPKEMLLYRWIAEGLIAERRGLTMIEVAEEYFNELLGRNMILPAQIGLNGSVETCKVHDMMLEVMLEASRPQWEANFVSLVGRQFIGVPYEKIRRLSVHGDEWRPAEEEEVTNKSPSKKTTKGPCVRRGIEEITLKHARSLVIFQSEDSSLLDRLGEFKLLRVLDLAKCKGLKDYHMKYVCQMYLLRFLNLCDTDITVIPPQISDLEHLQVLDVSGTLLSGLPETVTKLEKLERLMFSNRNYFTTRWRPPRGLSKMKALRVINKMRILDKNKEVAREIGELEQLEDLCLVVDCSDSTVLSQLATSLSKVHSLRSLNVRHTQPGKKALDFLLEMSPSLSLHYLNITGGISRLPDWVSSLTSLAHITLVCTKLAGDNMYDVLCKLPNLKKMILAPYGYSSKELVARSRHTFPALTYLSVSCDDAPEIIQFEEGSMAELETFATDFSYIERRSILGIEHLPSLKDVYISGPKDNCFMETIVTQLKSVSQSYPEHKQFQVTARYFDRPDFL